MAKRERKSTRKVIDKRLKQGRGQGTGSDYQPYLRVQDVPSQGLATRIRGWKTGREHHFLSLLECHYFFLLEWSPLIVDIREQFPLDLDETRAIAADLGIRHPTDPRTREPVVMTTDFVNTIRRPIGVIEHARTLKYAKDLANSRVMEKFEIERVYWTAREVDWGIVTELDIDSAVVENIKWVHPFHDVSTLAPLTADLISSIADVLTLRALAEDLPLRDLTAMCDEQFGLADGASLTVVRHLLATRRWQVDMRRPIRVPEKIRLIATPEISTATAVIKKAG
ncbi:MAG TPA: TnsA endonuclease N-terminal domain-containing protein [Blastocatellia bacterium]|jgi:CBS domain-containing protein|nr:TnsA endonuclease N-terminal domain-containing protein [Blastocatellia bacterium]